MVQGKINTGKHTTYGWASGLTSAHFHIPHFIQAGCPSCRSTNSVKALKATSTFGLGRRR